MKTGTSHAMSLRETHRSRASDTPNCVRTGAYTPSGLTALTTVTGDTAWIELRGELTGDTSRILIEAVRSNLHSTDPTALRIDMKHLEFLDARGLAALIVASRMAADTDTPITFERPSRLAAHVLELGGLGVLYRNS